MTIYVYMGGLVCVREREKSITYVYYHYQKFHVAQKDTFIEGESNK